jgi:hypothetical protein
VLDGPARHRPCHPVDVHDLTHEPLGGENEERKETEVSDTLLTGDTHTHTHTHPHTSVIAPESPWEARISSASLLISQYRRGMSRQSAGVGQRHGCSARGRRLGCGP